MKKKLIGVLAALLAVGMLGGCGSKDATKNTKTTDTTVLKDLDVDKFVTVGEYKGLQISAEPATVDEASVDEEVRMFYMN